MNFCALLYHNPVFIEKKLKNFRLEFCFVKLRINILKVH
jgi:hypothetical protein